MAPGLKNEPCPLNVGGPHDFRPHTWEQDSDSRGKPYWYVAHFYCTKCLVIVGQAGRVEFNGGDQ